MPFNRQSIQAFLGVYGNPAMLVHCLMGFSAGLPLVLLGTPLQAWLTDAGLSTVAIGLFSLVGLPYSLKFLWSPFLDRFVPPLPGRLAGSRRRSWLATVQVLLLLGIIWLGFQDPSQTDQLFLVALGVAFLSASQDIAIDAYRTDSLEERQMGAGAAVYVFGYRIAVLVAGSVALFLADRLMWVEVYGIMATLMVLGVVTSYFAPEPQYDGTAPRSLVAAIIEPFRAFLHRYDPIRLNWIPSLMANNPLATVLQRPQALITLLFIVVYQLADRISAPQTTTFLLKIGFSKTDLSIRIGIIFLATIAGVLLGGWAVNRLGILRSLFAFALLQGISNLSFMVVALLGKQYGAMIVATVIENFCGGTATAAFLAFLMSLCDRQFTATQYALLSSLFAFGGTLVGSWSGFVAQLGWVPFWGLTSLGALPGMILLPLIRPHSSRH